MEKIDAYINEILAERLAKFGLKEKYVKNICDDVREQMLALLYHWNDVKFRKAILILGLEEGKFYMPDADVDVKSFIVVTVRNSLIEIIFSDESRKMEIYKALPESYVRMITTDAINYFKDINFEELANEVSRLDIKDKYKEIAQKYPAAWEALVQLGSCNGKKVLYEKVRVEDKIQLDDLNKVNMILKQSNRQLVEDIQSGINGEFSRDLLTQLKFVLEAPEGAVFFVDSFKMLTRNFEKLLKVLEILLENDRAFLSCNFLITDSYIGRRANVYRAAHGNEEILDKMKDSGFLLGLSKAHSEALKGVVRSLEG